MSRTYYKPFKVELSDRDASYAEGDVRPGVYEVVPHGTLKLARVYERRLAKGARGTPSLRRVKHGPTIAAVIAKVGRG